MGRVVKKTKASLKKTVSVRNSNCAMVSSSKRFRFSPEMEDRCNSIKENIMRNRNVYRKSSCAIILSFQLVMLIVIFNYFVEFADADDTPMRGRHNKAMQFRESSKMFGGYRIVPKSCEASRPPSKSKLGLIKNGQPVCMFNHECTQRNGDVVGSCMDGFLFGACCQLYGPQLSKHNSVISGVVVTNQNNLLRPDLITPDKKHTVVHEDSPDLHELVNSYYSSNTQDEEQTSDSVAKITNALLQGELNKEDIIMETGDIPDTSLFSHSTISHEEADTFLISQNEKDVDDVLRPSDFMAPEANNVFTTIKSKPSTAQFTVTSSPENTYTHKPTDDAAAWKDSTTEEEEKQKFTAAPTKYYTQYTEKPVYHKPAFRPKPTTTKEPIKGHFVLVQTVTRPPHPLKGSVTSADANQEIASIQSIVDMLNPSNPQTIVENQSQPIKKTPSSLSTTTTHKAPSTSYVYSPTVTNRPEYGSTYPEKYGTSSGFFTRRPTIRNATKRPEVATNNYYGSSTLSYDDYWGSSSSSDVPQPPSTSYVYSSEPTKRPLSSIHNEGPSYEVSSTRPDTFSSVTPTVIVLDNSQYDHYTPKPPKFSTPNYQSVDSEDYPSVTHIQPLKRKPVRPTVSNNHVVSSTNLVHYDELDNEASESSYGQDQNEDRPQSYTSERPSPTVLITPKPSILSSSTRPPFAQVSNDELANFPPVRNPGGFIQSTSGRPELAVSNYPKPNNPSTQNQPPPVAPTPPKRRNPVQQVVLNNIISNTNLVYLNPQTLVRQPCSNNNCSSSEGLTVAPINTTDTSTDLSTDSIGSTTDSTPNTTMNSITLSTASSSSGSTVNFIPSFNAVSIAGSSTYSTTHFTSDSTTESDTKTQTELDPCISKLSQLLAAHRPYSSLENPPKLCPSVAQLSPDEMMNFPPVRNPAGFEASSRPGLISTVTNSELSSVSQGINAIPNPIDLQGFSEAIPEPPKQQIQIPQLILNNQISSTNAVYIGSGTKNPSKQNITSVESTLQASSDDLTNFPPVRNPNLNKTGTVPNNLFTSNYSTTDIIFQDVEFTTPALLFQEDDELNDKMSLFVNKIVGSFQDTFQELHDIVILDKTQNVTQNRIPTTRKPTKKPVKGGTTTTKKTRTTKKPAGAALTTIVTQQPTTKKPLTRATTAKPTKPRTTASTTAKPTKPRTQSTTAKPTKSRTPLTTTAPITTTILTTEVPVEEESFTTETPSGEFKHLCGVRPMVKSGRIVGGKGATFGEWPWQVLVRESTWLGLFTKNKCGGVLIATRYVTTAAHCQPGFLASLVAVMGEFDISGDLETKRSVTKNVRRVIVHRNYDAATFENDLAILELESPVHFDSHIVPICLPPDEYDFTGRMATVTGWGRLKYGGGVPSVLQEVQVPVIENSVCQEMFQTAGHSKIILNSFVCAGYANGQKDSCEGDSGGPLVLQRPDGRWQLVGTVSHGIKCAAPYLPGVYMRTTFYKPWLKSITGVH